MTTPASSGAVGQHSTPGGRQERAQELLRALLALYLDNSSSHPLGPGAEVRDVYLVDPGLAVDRPQDAFADGQSFRRPGGRTHLGITGADLGHGYPRN